MLDMPSETPACPDPTDRLPRLAAQLADMIPGAATLRVSLTDPEQEWPRAYARARDAAGNPVTVSRTTAVIAARWVLRAWPEADWTRPHTLDLTTATLTRSDLTTGRGR